MSILTTKFGGTSVGSVEALQQAAAIIKEQTDHWDHVVVVVSAMSGVTNALLSAARSASVGEEEAYTTTIDDIHFRHQETIRALLPKGEARTALETEISAFIKELRTFCHSILVMGEVTARGTDSIASLGERMNARVFSALLAANGTPSPTAASTRPDTLWPEQSAFSRRFERTLLTPYTTNSSDNPTRSRAGNASGKAQPAT